MTENTQGQQQQQQQDTRFEALKSQILQEIKVTVGDPNATLGEIEKHMGALYEWMTAQGLDGGGVVAAWERVLTLRTQGERAEDLAAASRAVANDMRDKLHATQEKLEKEQKVYADLIEALAEIDTEHPIVGSVYSVITDEYQEEIMTDGFFHPNPGWEIAQVYNVGAQAAEAFHSYLFEDYELSEDEVFELQEFITQFVEKVEARKRADIKRFNEESEEN